jgi:hypothetical protein
MPIIRRRKDRTHRLLLAAVLLTASAQAGAVDFDHEIAPLLRDRCVKCHGAGQKKAGLSLNTRADLLAGGEHGPVVAPGQAGGELLRRLTTDDEDDRMPPEGEPLTPAQVGRVAAWIAGGLAWTDGFAFKPPPYEPPLRPRRPPVPPALSGRTHPIDCFLDSWLKQHRRSRPEGIEDAAFFRRIHLDLVGLLPEPEALRAFLADRGRDKRTRAVHDRLADDTAYAEHWLTFWNDLLRNDYAGTGYIDGGRRQISAWLYRALLENKPYDQFARELIAPTAESEGFARGIQWRGNVSAGQSVPVQFAQSVGQAFLGINLKCASCHDSFVDNWKLRDAYGLAAVYAGAPLEMIRCDKPTGTQAAPAWLFPELGAIDTSRPRAEWLPQLATLMTDPQNGRFTRTLVNRIWARLMGRGLVHPLDAMQAEPWHPDLLDHLAVTFADQGYDLKKLMAYICTSQAYQSQMESVRDEPGAAYAYDGPRARRLTAEQFVDAVWQITGTAPTRYDAPVVRGRPAGAATNVAPQAVWIWSSAGEPTPAAGERVAFRRELKLDAAPLAAVAVLTADNGYTLWVNGREAGRGDDWGRADRVALTGLLRKGNNEILLLATNSGSADSPAGAWLEARLRLPRGAEVVLATDTNWTWTDAAPGADGRFTNAPVRWQPAVAVAQPGVWAAVAEAQRDALARAGAGPAGMVRAALLKSDLLQRALGRPNREQIVSARPDELTTLEAMDLNNGPLLDDWLQRGATNLLGRGFASTDDLVRHLYAGALAREPGWRERRLARAQLGEQPDAAAVADYLWALLMQPDFQLVR